MSKGPQTKEVSIQLCKLLTNQFARNDQTWMLYVASPLPNTEMTLTLSFPKRMQVGDDLFTLVILEDGFQFANKRNTTFTMKYTRGDMYISVESPQPHLYSREEFYNKLDELRAFQTSFASTRKIWKSMEKINAGDSHFVSFGNIRDKPPKFKQYQSYCCVLDHLHVQQHVADTLDIPFRDVEQRHVRLAVFNHVRFLVEMINNMYTDYIEQYYETDIEDVSEEWVSWIMSINIDRLHKLVACRELRPLNNGYECEIIVYCPILEQVSIQTIDDGAEGDKTKGMSCSYIAVATDKSKKASFYPKPGDGDKPLEIQDLRERLKISQKVNKRAVASDKARGK
jgi:hypothetical protein